MAINGPGVRGANPLQYYVNLTGQPFDDTYYLWVLTNTVPYIPTPVYHDPALTIPWTDPVPFEANGTLPIDVYWDPTQLYRLEYRHNVGPNPPSQADPLIYLVENYSPTGAIPAPPGGEGVTTENQISNPQFAAMNFSGTYTITGVTNPAPIEIAPGWFLSLMGTGNATISRFPMNADNPSPTNAPYALHLNLVGWSGNAILTQRFYQNGQNWQNQYISSSFTGLVVGSPIQVLVRLEASNGQPLGVLQDPQLSGQFAQYTGSVLIPAYDNLNTPPAAWIDYQVQLPGTCEVYLTSFQVIASTSDTVYSYEQTTVNRQLDHLAHYYDPLLAYKPIPSYLVGWDFPLNPAQFAPMVNSVVPAVATGNNGSFYTWDQTLLFQTVPSSVSVSRGTDGSFQATCALAGQIAVIQYLDATEARKIFSDRASVFISGYTNIANGLAGTVSLWACTDGALPSAANPTYLSGVSALSASAVPTMGNGTWVQMPNVFQNNTFTLPNVPPTNPAFNDIALNGWDFGTNAVINTANFFAIVVAFEPWVVANTINLVSIGLNAGDIATKPAPKTFSETLLDCEYFYWKTFENGTPPQQNIGSVNTGCIAWNANVAPMNTTANVDFPTLMRVVPTVTLYDPGGADAFAFNKPINMPCNPTALDTISTKRFSILATSPTGAAQGSTNFIHATADARLGIV
jgi:hypothetical protein